MWFFLLLYEFALLLTEPFLRTGMFIHLMMETEEARTKYSESFLLTLGSSVICLENVNKIALCLAVILIL